MTETDEIKYISEKERARIPDGDFAGPNHTFPIDSQAHVYAAAHLIGRAADPDRVKERVIAIARRKGYALPQAWCKDDDHDGDSMQDTDHDGKSLDFSDTLISFGSPVKSLGKNKIGGHLVIFTTKHDPDTYGDYFDAETDFDLEDGDRRTGYYNHGLDVKIGNKKIGTGTVTKDEIGLWLEAQLNERDEYCEAILQMVKDGALGLSSGALSHLVRREPVAKKIAHITHWPLGEWSLTPTPAEPRTMAMPLKTWAHSLKDSTLGDYTEHDMVNSALRSLHDRLMSHISSTLYNWYGDQTTANEKADAICNGLDEHNQIGKKMVRAMVSGNQTFAKSLIESAFTGDFKRLEINTVREFEEFLRDAGFSRKQATAITLHGFNSLRDAGENEPTPETAISAPPLDEATKQARETKFRILSHRLEGLLLAQ